MKREQTQRDIMVSPNSFANIPGLDTSCYPLIRRDQLHLLDQDMLQKLSVDLEEFSIPLSMNLTEEDRHMHEFAKQLCVQVKRRREQILAAERVAAMFSGTSLSIAKSCAISLPTASNTELQPQPSRSIDGNPGFCSPHPEVTSPRLAELVHKPPIWNSCANTEDTRKKSILPCWISDSVPKTTEQLKGMNGNIRGSKNSSFSKSKQIANKTIITKRGKRTISQNSSRNLHSTNQQSSNTVVKEFVVVSGSKSKKRRQEAIQRQQQVMAEVARKKVEKKRKQRLKKTLFDRKEVLDKLKDRMNRRKEWEKEREARIQRARDYHAKKPKNKANESNGASLHSIATANNGKMATTPKHSNNEADDDDDNDDDEATDIEDAIEEEMAAQAVDDSGQENLLLNSLFGEDSDTSEESESPTESFSTSAQEPSSKSSPSHGVASSLLNNGFGTGSVLESIFAENVTHSQSLVASSRTSPISTGSREATRIAAPDVVKNIVQTEGHIKQVCNTNDVLIKDNARSTVMSPVVQCISTFPDIPNKHKDTLKSETLNNRETGQVQNEHQSMRTEPNHPCQLVDETNSNTTNTDGETTQSCTENIKLDQLAFENLKLCDEYNSTTQSDPAPSTNSVSCSVAGGNSDSKLPTLVNPKVVRNFKEHAFSCGSSNQINQQDAGEKLSENSDNSAINQINQQDAGEKLSENSDNSAIKAQPDTCANERQSGEIQSKNQSIPTEKYNMKSENMQQPNSTHCKLEKHQIKLNKLTTSDVPLLTPFEGNEPKLSKQECDKEIYSSVDNTKQHVGDSNNNNETEECNTVNTVLLDTAKTKTTVVPQQFAAEQIKGDSSSACINETICQHTTSESSVNCEPNMVERCKSIATSDLDTKEDIDLQERIIHLPVQVTLPSSPLEKTIKQAAPKLPVVDYSEYYTSFESIFTNFARNRAGGTKYLRSSVEAWLREHFKTYDNAKRLLSSDSLCAAQTTNLGNDDATTCSELQDLVPSTWESVSIQLLYRVLSRSRSEVYNIVTKACSDLNKTKKAYKKNRNGSTSDATWNELPKGHGLKNNWNLLWTWSKPKVDWGTLLCWQKVNHFPGARVLTRKDLLKSQLQRFQLLGRRMKSEFEVLPPTFILPKEYLQFVEAFSTSADIWPRRNFWIMKPVGLSRGRGISLISDISDVTYGQSVVVQRYLHDPLLLDGYKFDLRLYVLVTSFQPLEAFIYDEGFVRMSTHPFSADASDLKNLFIHLTNSSIQKLGPNGSGVAATATSVARHSAEFHEAGGTKLSLGYLWRRLSESGIDVEHLQSCIRDVVLKSLVAANENIPNHPSCFEVYGYDVLIDRKLKPWLIEVNSSPSMSVDNSLDRVIKSSLIQDTINLLNPLSFDRSALHRVLERRIAELEQDRLKPYSSTTESYSQDALNRDLTDILSGRKPRKVGVMPSDMGKYRRLCPSTPEFDRIMSLKGCSLGARNTGHAKRKTSTKQSIAPTNFRSSYLWKGRTGSSTSSNQDTGTPINRETSKMVFSALASSAGVAL